MTNFQTNLTQNQMQYGYPYAHSVPSKGINEIKTQNNMAGKVADSYDPSENPSSMAKSFLYSLLMSTGFVRLTNWLMKPKTITDTMTQMDSYKQSRLYKIGEKIDKLPPLQWLSKQADKVKTAVSKIPLPKFVREIGENVKTGAIAPWDKMGMYSLGKPAEAMNETVSYFREAGEEALKNLRLTPSNKALLLDLMKKYKAGKISGTDAYNKLEPLIRNLSAKSLKEVKLPSGITGKLLGTTPDLNLSVSKSRFFLGAKASGPVGKAFNKLTALIGEASGGGVLGGTTALVMNAFGLMTGFNSAMKAEKGDKLKAFMEDYIGFTIGGYLMSMVVGKWFNKAVNVAEHGMSLDAIKSTASKLGLESVKRVEDVVIGYNREFKKTKVLQKLLNKFRKGKVVEGGGSIFGMIKNKLTNKVGLDEIASTLEKYGVDVTERTPQALKKALLNATKGRSSNFFQTARKEITKATKSNITIGSIFKQHGVKDKLNQLGRWLVQKPLAKAAKILSTGRYTLLKNGNFIGNAFRSLKRVGGGIFRIWLVGFVLVEPFRKAFVKLSHAIFGRPKHSMLDDEKEQEQQVQQPQQAPQNMPTNKNSQNLVDLYLQNMPKKPQNAQKQTEITPKTDSATYIPNQILTQESYIDPRLTEDLIARRDMAMLHSMSVEKNARELLGKI